MRIAALFLGLIAGLFVLLVPSALRFDLLSPFLEFWTNGASERLIGTIVWYAIAGAAVVGGVLATITPGFAAPLLLGAAVGWLGIAVSVPQMMTYHLLVPAGAAALGALFAFAAGELQIRRRRQARRSRKLALEAGPASAATDVEIEREAALQMDPVLMPRPELPITPRRTIPLTLDVTAISRPANDPPRRQDHPEPEAMPRDSDIGTEARHEPFTFAEELTTRRGQEPTSEPEFEPVFDLRPEPVLDLRREQVVDAIAEPRGEPKPEWQPERKAEPEQRWAAEPVIHREPPRPPRGGGWAAALAAVGAVLVLVVLAAGGYLLMRNGSLQTLFAPAAAPSVVATAEAPPAAVPKAPAKVEVPAKPTQMGTPAEPATSPDAATAAAVPAPSVVPPPTRAAEPAATAPLQVATASTSGSYDNPFSYCRSVGTIDYVDHRYAGPAVVDAMTRRLLLPAGTPRDRVHWRCFEGDVLACTSYVGPVCDTAPTVLEMREFCERNPNVSQLSAPSGVWSCADGKPELPPGASWPVDERGFLPSGWIKVPDPGAAPTG